VTSVGIDVGGTKCHGVLLSDSGEVLNELRLPTPHADQLVNLLEDMYRQLGSGNHVGLGIGVPGLITADGVIVASPNMRGAHNITVGPSLRERLSVSVHVENDATVAALAEWKVGAAVGTRDALMVTLGTGIGGGIVSGGELQRGSHGFAGEIGHMVVMAEGIECVCGQRGCWERYASGSAFRMLSGGNSGEDVVAAAESGDDSAINVVTEFARWVAVGLISLINLLDPEVVVIGGGVVESSHVIMPHVRDWCSQLLYSPSYRPHPRIETAVLGERAGAIGAAFSVTL